MTDKPFGMGDVPRAIRPNPVGDVVGGQSSFIKTAPKRRPENFLNNVVFVNMGFSVGVVSQEVLPANGGRVYLLIQNNSAGNIELSFGNKANGFDSIVIASGGNYEPWVIPFSSVNILAAAVDSRVVVVEGYGAQVE